MFQEILEKYNSQFAYGAETKTWCLYGTDADGNYWETDDFDADTLEQAENDAIEYLEANNEPA